MIWPTTKTPSLKNEKIYSRKFSPIFPKISYTPERVLIKRKISYTLLYHRMAPDQAQNKEISYNLR